MCIYIYCIYYHMLLNSLNNDVRTYVICIYVYYS